MKVKMTKYSMERLVHPSDVSLLEAAGWKVAGATAPSAKKEVVTAEEVIILKPPAKSKGADIETLDNANQQGDE